MGRRKPQFGYSDHFDKKDMFGAIKSVLNLFDCGMMLECVLSYKLKEYEREAVKKHDEGIYRQNWKYNGYPNYSQYDYRNYGSAGHMHYPASAYPASSYYRDNSASAATGSSNSGTTNGAHSDVKALLERHSDLNSGVAYGPLDPYDTEVETPITQRMFKHTDKYV